MVIIANYSIKHFIQEGNYTKCFPCIQGQRNKRHFSGEGLSFREVVTCPRSQQEGAGPALAGFCPLAELSSSDGNWWWYGKTKAQGMEGLWRSPKSARSPAALPDKLVLSLSKVAGQVVGTNPLLRQAALPPSRPAAHTRCQPLFPVSQPSRGAVQDIVSRARAKYRPHPHPHPLGC